LRIAEGNSRRLGGLLARLPIRFAFCYSRCELGWEPCFTFQDGLLETIPWYVEFLEREESC
jgi:dTDP-D-glucose 4,6-dehydratase